MSRPYSVSNALHRDPAVSLLLELLGDKYYMATMPVRPTTATIYNVTTSGAGWTAVATGLSGVLSWRLSEANANDFYYAFVAAPTAQATAFGWTAEQTEISAIYIKRKTDTNITGELVVWTA